MMQDSQAIPVRAIVVDDSKLMRQMIVTALQAEGSINVVGEAADTSQARMLIRDLNPDVITLDVEMPGMNGIDFLKKIMELRPMPVIMVSTLTAAGTDVSLAALHLGAVDAIQKPASREDLPRFARALREKVLTARGARVAQRGLMAGSTGHLPPLPASARIRTPQLMAIGASTGGVAALGTMLAALPAQTPPIVITQHMPPNFTARFAARLDQSLPQHVTEAKDGEVLRPGQIRIAPGDLHLAVQNVGGRYCVKLDDSGPISGHRPSVDVLFNAVSTAVGSRALGVILTGMGRDGAAGMRAMRNAGAYCIGQAEASCVVYGMPKAARELQGVDEELDLSLIAPRICGILNPDAARRTA